MRGRLQQLLRAQSPIIARALVEGGGTLPEAYWTEFSARLQELIEPWLARVTISGIAEGARAIGQQVKAAPGVAAGVQVAWDIVNRAARQEALSYTYELVRGITESTHVRIQDAVAAWIASGNEFPALTADIRPVIAALEQVSATALQADYRARLIAMTESTRAYADGNQRAWDAAGWWGRRWRTAVDERQCPICGALRGQQVQAGAPFEVVVQGEKISVLNPPAHPGCRCSITPVLEPDGLTRKPIERMTL